MSDKTATALLALDWGTSALRAFRLGADGTVLDTRARPWGILSLPEGGYPAAYAAITETWRRPGLPAIACGMVGSRSGWREVPYLPLPFGPDGLAGALCEIGCADGTLHLVPGLLDPAGPDVMRGEETEVLGALERLGRPAGALTLVMPGTHCKWVRVLDNRVVSFATAMTGELFAVLSSHSILAQNLPASDAKAPDDAPRRAAFRDGVLAGAAAGLSSGLFRCRARQLVGALSPALVRDALSGLLIGDELRGFSGGGEERVVLVGADALTARYAEAFAILDRPVPVRIGSAAGGGLFRIAVSAGLLAAPTGELPC